MNSIIIGSGFGGIAAALRLKAKGHKVTIIDLFIYGEDVLPKNDNLKIIKGDIRDEDLLSL